MSDETARRFEAEKAAYWAMREELLKQYWGKWVAIVNGTVVAIGNEAGKVIQEAFRKTGSEVGFAARVGYEDAVRRIRQITSGRYDENYDPPIPTVVTPVTNFRADRSTEVEFIIDTGSDATTLQSDVADELNLWDRVWGRARVAGVGGVAEERNLYAAIVQLGGQAITVQADCRDDLGENLLGRDVLNEFELTVCAKRDVVRFEWVADE